MTVETMPVAIVTGGGTGIGAACVKILSQEGFRVGIHYSKSEAQAQTVLDEIQGKGFLIQADLAHEDQVESMVQKIKEVAGQVDVLVNNAGMTINEPILTMKMENFDRQRSLTRGAWYLTKRVLRLFMFRKSKGRIINISSVVGHTGNAGQIPYTMEKASLDAMTKSLAKELWGRNILVNSVAPGFIDTKMTHELDGQIKETIMKTIPLERMGTPEEVAQVVGFLAVKGTYINGTVIHVNGGMYGG
ncbi:MAG: 3-oxoacyl-ACP reductase FabG [Proteobacteria bacterium]|nr:3-oxoacyl-ACP reductase FabG [Pseudomonadota bacterium]MBU1389816.1 3-oxoacyl-ACP reductase FabG [Pseudomonadota bacterium]MBU1543825.1 3-oxoacyl-ACP reductase FabG [Pseudomonadota bacterium]MBU2430405.1 3-oxoacyl-ACP reductase FabG [Pseudomonadota bacterium]